MSLDALTNNTRQHRQVLGNTEQIAITLTKSPETDEINIALWMRNTIVDQANLDSIADCRSWAASNLTGPELSDLLEIINEKSKPRQPDGCISQRTLLGTLITDI
jgi:hypothetical protein